MLPGAGALPWFKMTSNFAEGYLYPIGRCNGHFGSGPFVVENHPILCKNSGKKTVDSSENQ
jgi:hypothetical protein